MLNKTAKALQNLLKRNIITKAKVHRAVEDGLITQEECLEILQGAHK